MLAAMGNVNLSHLYDRNSIAPSQSQSQSHLAVDDETFVPVRLVR